jgi:iron complex outermembrane recepter protein
MTKVAIEGRLRVARQITAKSKFMVRSTLSLAIAAIANPLFAQGPDLKPAQVPASTGEVTTSAALEKVETIVVTGSRIKSASLTSTSPVSQLAAEEISMLRALTVEDFSTKLPQLAGGVNSTSAGSDAFGAQTLDLRNLGQSRTLVLINGTRAVPFSFRNAVDVNFIPAPLLKRVDVLTGGAAAVYGADAIAGVVNFVINDNFRGAQASANFRSGKGGGSQSGVNLTGGIPIGDRGSLVGFLDYAERQGLLAGERDWALKNSVPLAGIGGNFTDVASGRTFSFDNAGKFTTTPQTTDYTSQFTLIQPLKRTNASAFFKYDVLDNVQAYGRFMFSNVQTTGAPRSGQAPAVISGTYGINSNNAFLPAEARSLLTFVNGVAQVKINRSLGELGVITADNDRNTQQLQLGVRGSFTDAVGWDIYAQTGRSAESVVVNGDGNKTKLPGLINTVNLFGPGADVSALAQPFKYGDRTRKQSVLAASISGDSGDFFKLPAGSVGFALGAEARRETGQFDYNPDLGLSFRQGTESAPPVPPYFDANEYYGEVLIPLVAKLPFVKNLSLEGAYRSSSYKKSVGPNSTYGTDKIGASWTITDDLRLRATKQSVIREPNFGEFANPVFSIPFANLVNVARLRPRYQGDPCVLGTGNAAQCARFGAPAIGSYNSLDAANLTGGYFFGGNPDIKAERGKTTTFGGVITPKSLPGFSMTLDYYSIELKDAVGQVQPVDALTSCYITDPRPGNPLCQAVTRDPVTGRVKDGFPVDRNLAFIKQKGVDVDVSFKHNLPAGMLASKLAWQYQAAVVRSYSIQKNAVLDPINCKASYGFRCSSDSVTLVAPSYRHRASVSATTGIVTTQVGWKRIGKVNDSTVGSTESIAAQDYFDINFSVASPIRGLTVNFGVDNVTKKQPPFPKNAGTFNTYPDTYNVIGRTYGLSLTYKM